MKKNLKKFVLVLVLLVVCSFSVSAEEDDDRDYQESIETYEQEEMGEETDSEQEDLIQTEYDETDDFTKPDDFSESDEFSDTDDFSESEENSDVEERDDEEDADEEDLEEIPAPEPIRPAGGMAPEPEIYLLEEKDPEEGILPQIDYDETELFFELEARVKNALLAGETRVDISELYIDPKKFGGYSMVYFSPYFSNGIELAYASWPDRYAYIEITNPMSLSETKSYFRRVDAKVDEILQQVTPNMSDEQKALIIHDYLVYEYEYDYDRLQNGTMPSDSYKCGGIIMNGTGVCQAYADSYRYIMNKLGIECYVTGNSDMKHVWNIINIDNSYYHVDCTWDDPTYDRWGNVGHTYFLLSDQAIQEKNHYGWNLTNYVCNNLQYDAAYWQGIESNIIIEGNLAYYISQSERTIHSRDLSSGATQKLKELEKWKVWGSSAAYGIPFSGLFLANGELYYNTPEEIRKISLDGQNDEVFYKPDTSIGYIYGSRKHEGDLQYVIKTSAAHEDEQLRESIPLSIPVQISYDANGGEVFTDSATVLAGLEYGVLAEPTRYAYKFAGWYTAKSGGVQITSSSIVSKVKSHILYAHWTANKYTIRYDQNGATSGSMQDTNCKYGTAYKLRANKFKKTGYTFAGWSVKKNGAVKYKDKESIENLSDQDGKVITLYAKWTKNSKYTVRYNKNGATSGSMKDAVCKYGTTYSLRANAFKRTGYKFTGWSVKKNGPVKYKNKERIKNLSSKDGKVVTLYAQWTPNKYTIRYNKNGATGGSMKATNCKYGTASKLRANQFTKKGYKFAGWATSAKGPVKYKNKDSVKNLSSKDGKTVTLYAKWVRK